MYEARLQGQYQTTATADNNQSQQAHAAKVHEASMSSVTFLEIRFGLPRSGFRLFQVRRIPTSPLVPAVPTLILILGWLARMWRNLS